jgi:hypothetical protein
MAKAPKKAAAPKANAQPVANMGAGADEQNAKAPAASADQAKAKAAPSHADRLDKLEQDHAALLDIARSNGWSLPE